MSRQVLVTGASRGIGLGIAERLAAGGWSVLAPTRAELDLAEPSSVTAYLSALDGLVSGLVLNAGINRPARIDEMASAHWQAIQQVNLDSSFQLISGLAPAMAGAGFGRIVAVSSAYATRSRAGRAAYSASKAALEALVRSTALEFAEFGVLANCVAPGFVDTDLTRANNSAEAIELLLRRVPVGRLASVADVSRAVEFLMSPDNSYITGQTLAVDGGFLCT